jgi:hypothetical protein
MKSPDTPKFAARMNQTEAWLDSRVNGYSPHAEADFVFAMSTLENRSALVRIIVSRVAPVVSFGVVLLEQVDDEHRSALVEMSNMFNEAIAWGRTFVSFVHDRLEFTVGVSVLPEFTDEQVDRLFGEGIRCAVSAIDDFSPYLHELLHDGQKWHEVGFKFLQEVGIIRNE